MTTATATVTKNATKDDAQSLSRIYARLSRLTKDLKRAQRAVSEGWVNPDRMYSLRSDRDEAQFALDQAMDECWQILKSLPSNTVASGGATPQTIGLEFFNRNLNRNLRARMTAAEAKRTNRISFG